MSFQLPSAASRGVVSILNEGHAEKAQRTPVISLATCDSPKQQDARPPLAALPYPKPNDAMNNSYSSTSSAATQSSSGSSYSSCRQSGYSTDATSVEPSPQPPASLGKAFDGIPDDSDATGRRSRTRTLSRPGFAASHTSLSESPAPASTRLIGENDRITCDVMDTSPDYPHQSPFERPAVSSSSSLTRHHSLTDNVGSAGSGGKKRYPCSHAGCDKTFSTSGHAARHNRIHTGQKPYRCTFPGCKATFSRQDNALAHFRTGHALAKQRANSEGGRSSYDPIAGALGPNQDPRSDAEEQHAAVQLGRKALEEGTAIAVVRGGRVERTVGLPQPRRASGSTSRSAKSPDGASRNGESLSERSGILSSSTHLGHTPAAEYAQSRSSPSFASGDARQRTYAGEHSRIYPPSSSSSSSSSSRMHPYYAGLSASGHRASVSGLYEQTTGGQGRMFMASSDNGSGPGHYALPSPSSHTLYLPSQNPDGGKRRGSQSLHPMSAPLGFSTGLRRGSVSAAKVATPALLPIFPAHSHNYMYPLASPSSTSSSSPSSMLGQWSSMRLDGAASNVRAQRVPPNLSHHHSRPPNHAGSSASSSPVPSQNGVQGRGRGEGARSTSPPTSRSLSSLSIPSPRGISPQSNAVAPSAPRRREDQLPRPKLQLPISSDRLDTIPASRSALNGADARGRGSAEGLTLPPLRLPA